VVAPEGGGTAPLTASGTPCPSRTRTRFREPTADVGLAAAHGVDPGSASFPTAMPLSRPNPTLALVATLRVRASSRTPSLTRSRAPALVRATHTAAHAGDGLTTTVTTPVLRPFEPSSLGVSLWLPVLASHPGAVGLAAGEVTPRRHLSLLGISSST
jgi:hypothetical protein